MARVRIASGADRATLSALRRSASSLNDLAISSKGFPKGRAADLLASLQHEIPRLRGELQHGWRLYSVWNRVELATQAEPLPFEVWQACVGKLLIEGSLVIAAVFALAFQGLLRPSEALKLNVRDITPDARRVTLVVRLHATKTSQRSGMPESIVIGHAETVTLVLAAMLNKDPLCNFSGLSYAQFYRELQRCMVFFGLSQRYIRPHSFRRGGATHLWSSTGNLDLVTQAGRWSSQHSARVYLADASCESVLQALTSAQRAVLSSYARAFVLHCGCCHVGERGIKRLVLVLALLVDCLLVVCGRLRVLWHFLHLARLVRVGAWCFGTFPHLACLWLVCGPLGALALFLTWLACGLCLGVWVLGRFSSLGLLGALCVGACGALALSSLGLLGALCVGAWGALALSPLGMLDGVSVGPCVLALSSLGLRVNWRSSGRLTLTWLVLAR
eukprot:3786426-Amphidinium_carterae.1